MIPIKQLIHELRARPDISILDQNQSWLVTIAKSSDLICEVTIPHDVLEWFASVKHRREKKELWSDWMDYCGYDDSPREKLEADMARDILAFINRASTAQQLLPIEIYKE